MVALAVASLALLTMIGVFTSGLRLMTQGEAVTSATETGRDLLEAVKEQGYALVPATDQVFDGTKPVPDPPVAGFPPAPYPAPNMRVIVEQVQPGLKSVTVQVFREKDVPVTLETYLAEPPP